MEMDGTFGGNIKITFSVSSMKMIFLCAGNEIALLCGNVCVGGRAGGV